MVQDRVEKLENEVKNLNVQLATLTAQLTTITANTASLQNTMNEMVALKNKGMGFIAAISMIGMIVGYALNHILDGK
jgi:prefoldin subunit 5